MHSDDTAADKFQNIDEELEALEARAVRTKLLPTVYVTIPLRPISDYDAMVEENLQAAVRLGTESEEEVLANELPDIRDVQWPQDRILHVRTLAPPPVSWLTRFVPDATDPEHLASARAPLTTRRTGGAVTSWLSEMQVDMPPSPPAPVPARTPTPPLDTPRGSPRNNPASPSPRAQASSPPGARPSSPAPDVPPAAPPRGRKRKVVETDEESVDATPPNTDDDDVLVAPEVPQAGHPKGLKPAGNARAVSPDAPAASGQQRRQKAQPDVTAKKRLRLGEDDDTDGDGDDEREQQAGPSTSTGRQAPLPPQAPAGRQHMVRIPAAVYHSAVAKRKGRGQGKKKK